MLHLFETLITYGFFLLLTLVAFVGIYNVLFQLPGDVEKIAKEMQRHNDREEKKK